MSDFGRDRSDSASKDQRETNTGERAGGQARQETPSMLGAATAAYGKGAIQRKIADRAAKRSAGPADGGGGGGSALPEQVQAKMENSFGADFSDVRVHQGGQADQLCAKAFARGNELHFAPGQYDPSSQGGQALIGHELTHVVQQRAGRVATQGKDGPINNDPSLESEADQMGARAARGEPAHVTGSSAGLQRKGAEEAPIQCDGVDVEKLGKLSKGGLARKNLEATSVTGQDAQGQDRSSPRGDALAAAINKGAFQATADMLAGPSFDSQPAFQQAFISAWKGLNKGYDDKGAQGAVLLDPILTAKFKGNKLGYLQDLRMNGHSSPEWLVLMCLGEIEGGLASDDAVVRAFERAAEQLDNAKFKTFWTRVEAPLRKSMHHLLTSDRRLRRVLAAKDMKEAEAPVAQAEADLQTAENAEHQADLVKEATEKKLKAEETDAGTKKTAEHDREGDVDKAKAVETRRQLRVDHETARVDERRTKAAQADKDLTSAQTKLDTNAQTLEEANQAFAEATAAYQLAMRRYQNREARLGKAKLAALPKPDAPVHDEETPQEESDQVRKLKEKADRSWQRAFAAKQKADAAQAQIEKFEAELAKSKEGVSKAKSAQDASHESLHRHEEELKARQAKLDEAKKNVKDAEKIAAEAKVEADKAEKAVEALKAQLAIDDGKLVDAKKEVSDKKDVLKDKKKDQLDSRTEVAYLAALIESMASKLNDFDREALDKLQEWTTAHKQAIPQAMTAGSPFLVAVDKHIKKDRNKEFIKALIKGDKSAAVKDTLAGTGNGNTGLGFSQQQTEHAMDQVTMTALVVDREAQKHTDKKVQIRVGPAKIEHTILKQQLLSMSPDAREQYLAFSTNTSQADLQDEGKRNKALHDLDDKLKDACGVTDAKERERMLALFKVAGAGPNYSKLYGLVHTTDSKKYPTDEDFGKKALAYVTEFGEGEFHQLRQDKEVLAAVKVCKKKADINKLVGGLDMTGDITPLTATKADADKAETDALHRAAHWSTLINVEMEKYRFAPMHERSRNDIYLYGHRAQMTAIEVAKLKNSADPTASTPAHADAKKFVQDVWAGVDKKSSVESAYPDLATALANGGEVTLQMVLDSIAKFGIGSWKIHVNKEDIQKTIETSNGKELLEKWSNIDDFKTAKSKVNDPVKQRELARTFVLDVNADKRTWLDQAAGGESLKYANMLRERFKKAADSDAEFKAGLAAAGYDNTVFNREQIEFRGLLEKAHKQRKGLDFDGISSKGHAQHQAQREFVGGLREANKDDQGLNVQKDGLGGHHDQHIDKERDERFEEHHAKSLDEKKEELEISGEEFDKLRENVRKYTEIAIALIISIAVSAATMGAIPAWAVVLAKVGAIILADIVKEVVGNAITGDKMNAQKLVTNIAADSIATAAGGFAGMGFEMHAAKDMNVFLKEFIKGTVVSTTKSFSKDTVKAIAEKHAGDVTITGAIKNQVMGFIVSAASSQLTAAAMEAKGLGEKESDVKAHEEAIKPDKDHIQSLETGDKPTAEHGVEDAQHDVDGAQSVVTDAQHTVDTDSAAVTADQANITTDTTHLTTANDQVAQAQQHLTLAQQHYQAAIHDHAGKTTIAYDRHQVELARAQLHTAQMNVTTAQHSLETDQARLESDEARLSADEAALDHDNEALESANENLEVAKQNLEGIESQIKALEDKIKPDEDIIASDEAQINDIEIMGKRIDDAADKILDVPADIIMETIGERHERKLEKVTPKKKAEDPKALVQAPQPVAHAAAHPVAHGAPQPVAQHGKKGP